MKKKTKKIKTKIKKKTHKGVLGRVTITSNSLLQIRHPGKNHLLIKKNKKLKRKLSKKSILNKGPYASYKVMLSL